MHIALAIHFFYITGGILYPHWFPFSLFGTLIFPAGDIRTFTGVINYPSGTFNWFAGDMSTVTGAVSYV